jgi:hypothetical protein
MSDDRDVRAGIQQAKVGATGFNAIILQSLIIAGICGLGGTWQFGVAILIFMIALLFGAAAAPPLVSKVFPVLSE